MKIMAIDLGDAHTGVAFSDLTGFIAGRCFTVHEHGRERLLSALMKAVDEEKPERIVVGLPVNMNGTEGGRAEKCRAFARELENRCGVETVMWDERGTSVTANRILSDAGKKRAKQRARVDALAAGIILQSYLDFENMKKGG